jgi:tagaturonate reductase
MARGDAMGAIAVVQTSTSPESRRLVQAFNQHSPYPVQIRGVEAGRVVDRQVLVSSVARAFDAVRDWAAVEDVVHEDLAIVSNTGSSSFRLDPGDDIGNGVAVSFLAKLARLPHVIRRAGERFRFFRASLSPTTETPCSTRDRCGAQESARSRVRRVAFA